MRVFTKLKLRKLYRQAGDLAGARNTPILGIAFTLVVILGIVLLSLRFVKW